MSVAHVRRHIADAYVKLVRASLELGRVRRLDGVWTEVLVADQSVLDAMADLTAALKLAVPTHADGCACLACRNKVM